MELTSIDVTCFALFTLCEVGALLACKSPIARLDALDYRIKNDNHFRR